MHYFLPENDEFDAFLDLALASSSPPSDAPSHMRGLLKSQTQAHGDLDPVPGLSASLLALRGKPQSVPLFSKHDGIPCMEVTDRRAAPPTIGHCDFGPMSLPVKNIPSTVCNRAETKELSAQITPFLLMAQPTSGLNGVVPSSLPPDDDLDPALVPSGRKISPVIPDSKLDSLPKLPKKVAESPCSSAQPWLAHWLRPRSQILHAQLALSLWLVQLQTGPRHAAQHTAESALTTQSAIKFAGRIPPMLAASARSWTLNAVAQPSLQPTFA